MDADGVFRIYDYQVNELLPGGVRPLALFSEEGEARAYVAYLAGQGREATVFDRSTIERAFGEA